MVPVVETATLAGQVVAEESAAVERREAMQAEKTVVTVEPEAESKSTAAAQEEGMSEAPQG